MTWRRGFSSHPHGSGGWEENVSNIIFMELLFWTLSSFNLQHSLPAARKAAHGPSTPAWSCPIEAVPWPEDMPGELLSGTSSQALSGLRSRPPPSNGVRALRTLPSQ